MTIVVDQNLGIGVHCQLSLSSRVSARDECEELLLRIVSVVWNRLLDVMIEVRVAVNVAVKIQQRIG